VDPAVSLENFRQQSLRSAGQRPSAPLAFCVMRKHEVICLRTNRVTPVARRACA
jgi:hypothetical protein